MCNGSHSPASILSFSVVEYASAHHSVTREGGIFYPGSLGHTDHSNRPHVYAHQLWGELSDRRMSDECQQTLTTPFALNRHQLSHTGERRSNCKIPGCNQRFFNDGDCKRHEKSKKASLIHLRVRWYGVTPEVPHYSFSPLIRRQLHCPARELILGDSVRSYSKLKSFGIVETKQESEGIEAPKAVNIRKGVRKLSRIRWVSM
ncbi:hypothetical protein BKA83DRAFT_4126372 [Pisolithus microcarpus]|nr:hypothetical protein BKA83DRAFT_4126372 [Pisolithus microcarpus]